MFTRVAKVRFGGEDRIFAIKRVDKVQFAEGDWVLVEPLDRTRARDDGPRWIELTEFRPEWIKEFKSKRAARTFIKE